MIRGRGFEVGGLHLCKIIGRDAVTLHVTDSQPVGWYSTIFNLCCDTRGPGEA